MHPWDALAGLLLIEEAGGRVGAYPGPDGLVAGGAVLGAAPGIYDAWRRSCKAESAGAARRVHWLVDPADGRQPLRRVALAGPPSAKSRGRPAL